jgi:hypothetical protein
MRDLHLLRALTGFIPIAVLDTSYSTVSIATLVSSAAEAILKAL